MGHKKRSWKHILVVFLISFCLAVVASLGTEMLMRYTNIFTAFILLLAIILVGIIFDVVGTAVAAATETPHHAKAANRVSGAKQTVFLVRNADTVANFTNDIVGDVVGALSGGMATSIVLQLIEIYPQLDQQQITINTFLIGLVASITVTGKAIGKSIGINQADEIMGKVGILIAKIENFTGISITDRKKRKGVKRNGNSRKD